VNEMFRAVFDKVCGLLFFVAFSSLWLVVVVAVKNRGCQGTLRKCDATATVY
jgi:hypothetical protein